MKRLYIIIILVMFAVLIFAEDNLNSRYEPNTLFDNKDLSLGGYGGPIFQGIYMNNQVCYISGGEGGMIINHQFIIGGEGKGVVTPLNSTNNSRIYMGWGGLLLGYIYAPENVIHPYIKTIIGAGGASEVTNGSYYSHDNHNINMMSFFSLEGEIGAEINIIKWMRVAIFSGYHYIYGPVSFNGITDSNLYGFDFGVRFEFGKF